MYLKIAYILTFRITLIDSGHSRSKQDTTGTETEYSLIFNSNVNKNIDLKSSFDQKKQNKR